MKCVRATHREHETLRGKIGQLHEELTDWDPSAEETVHLLNEFEEAIVVHVSHEVEDGLFDDVTAKSLLGSESSKLCFEHEVLQKESEELCRSTAPDANRCHDRASWPVGATCLTRT